MQEEDVQMEAVVEQPEDQEEVLVEMELVGQEIHLQ